MYLLLGVALAASIPSQPAAADSRGTAALSSVSGRVTDANGEPVEGARVRPGLLADWPGKRVFVQLQVPTGWAVTDANGQYRLAFEAPSVVDVYILVNVPRAHPGSEVRYRLADAFHPGVATLDEATPIRLEPGTHRPGVDVVVPRVEMHGVAVVLGGAEGARDVRIVLVASSGNVVRNLPWPPGRRASAPARLPSGRYLVWARAAAADGRRAAWAAVDLLRDMELQLDLEPAGRLHGRVVTERGGLPPDPRCQVVADLLLDGRPVDPLAPDRTDVGPDGRFSLDGLFGPRRLRLLGLPEGWRVIAVRQGRSDRTESGFDIAPAETVSDVEIIVGLR